MSHNHDCAREPVQDVPVPESVRYIPIHRVTAPVTPTVTTPLLPPETLGSEPDTRLGISGRGATLLVLSLLVPLAILICYQPAVGLVILVSAGLYLTNQYIDQQAESRWGEGK